MKSKLTLDALEAEAGAFATLESAHREPALFGVTDGKAVGTYFEHKFREHLPTCGRGAFLLAALEAFPRASNFLGVDQEGAHVREATRATNSIRHDKQVQILQGDFFDTDWSDIVARLPKPILIVGNPPWVTNATLGSLGSANLPAKANEDNLRGIDALTGKSNFDISVPWSILEGNRPELQVRNARQLAVIAEQHGVFDDRAGGDDGIREFQPMQAAQGDRLVPNGIGDRHPVRDVRAGLYRLRHLDDQRAVFRDLECLGDRDHGDSVGSLLYDADRTT